MHPSCSGRDRGSVAAALAAFTSPLSVRNAFSAQRGNPFAPSHPARPHPGHPAFADPTRCRRRPRIPNLPIPVVQPTACASSSSPDNARAPPSRANGFVIWGPPASGKTSLCDELSHRHGLVHIATGDLLRAHVRYNTKRGSAARAYVNSGRAVPDSIVIPMVLERLSMADCIEHGFILDGFPRSVAQDTALKEAGFGYATAFMLHAPRTLLERRIQNRRIDPDTGRLYNLRYRVPEEQEVQERLVALDKDVGRNISKLLALYGRVAADMFARITATALRVDADRDVEDILDEISAVLQQHGVPGMKEQVVGSRAQRDGRFHGVLRELGSPGDVSSESDSDRPIDALEQSDNGSWQGNGHGSFVIGADEAAPAERNSYSSTDEDGVELNSNNGLEDTSRGVEGHHVRSDDSVNDSTGRGPTQKEKKSPITLIRCDGYMCERESVDGSNIAFRGAATEQVMLVWNRRPSTVLLLSKKDPDLMGSVLEAARYLVHQNLHVVVESWVQTEALANGLYLESFTRPETLHEEIDFVVCLGGDGLILHVSTLFSNAVPPVLSFNLGSLGFLTPFDYVHFQDEINALLDGSCLLSLRMRLTCSILRDGASPKDFEVLNEVVVDRGASPYLSNLDCFCDDKYITTVQADGIIMSTPTGSTAYSMSAGGSMVHPSVPAILFTPICPHSLSFRPIVFPDAAKLRIDIAEDSRSHAWASFDGKFRQQLRRGDGLVVQMSLYPVPTVNQTDHTGDWFQSLDRAFNFNSRAIQKALNDGSRGTDGPPRSGGKRGVAASKSKPGEVDKERTVTQASDTGGVLAGSVPDSENGNVEENQCAAVEKNDTSELQDAEFEASQRPSV